MSFLTTSKRLVGCLYRASLRHTPQVMIHHLSSRIVPLLQCHPMSSLGTTVKLTIAKCTGTMLASVWYTLTALVNFPPPYGGSPNSQTNLR